VAVESNVQWQGTIWRILSDPATEVVATIAVVLGLAWFMIQTGGLHPGAFVGFGRG
jgi:hypothetical protein